MLEKIFHLLTGSAEFEIKGDPARFLNIAAKSGFALWGFSRRGELAAACCRPGDYRRLRPLAVRCGTRLRCVKKRGVPFSLRRFWKRKGLVLGILCGAGLYFFLSGFVWGVSVSGTEHLGDCRVLEAARQSGVYPGASKRRLEPKLAARSVISQLPDLRWAAVNTNGCFVEVAVREREKKPEITDDTQFSNIVAVRPGTIVALEAERGRPEVRLGDTVQEGQLLISGLYQEKLDPWSPPPADPFQNLGAARGSVRARTYREFAVQVSALKKELVPSGKVKTRKILHIFGLRIPLGPEINPGGPCRQYTVERSLQALGVTLPLSLEQETAVMMEEKNRRLSREEMKEEALRKLREAQKAEIPAGGRIVQEKLSYIFPEGMCILSACSRCEEEIGALQPVLVNSTETGQNY